MNQDELLRQQQRNMEASLAESQRLTSEIVSREATNNLSRAKSLNTQLRQQISDKEKNINQLNRTLENNSIQHIEKTSGFLSSVYPYYIKSKVYKNVVDNVLSHLSDSEALHYKELFKSIKSDKSKSDIALDIFNEKKRTSNF